MKATHITVPELALVAGTRAALGAGLGFLLADRFDDDQRQAIGWTLFLVGALSTIPLALEVFGGQRLFSTTTGSEKDARRPFSGAKERLGQESAFAMS